MTSWAGYQTVLERLNASPYDELVEIDLFNDRCRNLWHVENKYYVPVLHGDWSELYRYCADHMVHPDDRETYLAMMDPDTLRQRLEQSEIPGVLSEELRYRTVNGEWLWVGQVVVSGAQGALPEGVVYTYLYDINVQKQRELGDVAVTGSTAIHRDDLTGLLLDRDFHALAQLKLPELSGKWCVMALDIENFKLFCDWHGQQTGHILLAQIGEILLRQEQETGGLAGYRGQDDFELLIPYDTERINRLYEALQKLIVAQGDSVGFLPMFGICMIEGPDEEIMELYNRAAMTAERIKGDFKNRIQIYDPDIHRLRFPAGLGQPRDLLLPPAPVPGFHRPGGGGGVAGPLVHRRGPDHPAHPLCADPREARHRHQPGQVHLGQRLCLAACRYR